MHIQSNLPTKYHHSKEDVDELILKQQNDLRDVLHCFCLKQKCTCRVLEYYQANGHMPYIHFECEPCGTNCIVCTGDWAKTFRKVSKEGVIKFFTQEDDLPIKAVASDLIDLI